MQNFELEIIQKKIHENILQINYFAKNDFTNNSSINSVIETFNISEKARNVMQTFNNNLSSKDLAFSDELLNAVINPGGWQSWAPGFELLPSQNQLSLKNKRVPQWNCYLQVPGTDKKDFSKQNILAQFITYFRVNQKYFVIASTGNVKDKNIFSDNIHFKNNATAPVQFVINRKKNLCKITVADVNKSYKQNELVCQICFFVADSYFEAKEKIEKLFGSSIPESPEYSKRFDSVLHLGKLSAGWESWYNHYANINEKIILDDLESIGKTENLISLHKKNVDSPCVFQIDDGWEVALGQWKWNDKRFNTKPEILARKISDYGFIPGLWLAPFIIDIRSKIAREHPSWLLKNNKGNLVQAGFNPLWGPLKCNIFKTLPGSFYCLDLSNKEVLSYLDNLMDTVINAWGFEYLKLDFLYAGMLNGTFINGGCAFEHYNNAVNILTKRTTSNKGNKVCYLGCGAPFEMSFNNFPLCRIGADTREHWEDEKCRKINWNGRTSAYMNMQDTIGRSLWNKSIFLSDPDVLFVRNENCTHAKEEKLLIATVAFMFASQMMYSDDPATSDSPEEILIAKEILELKQKYYGKNFSAILVSDKVYSVKEESSGKEYIINLSDKDYFVKNQKIIKHSAKEL